MIKQTRIIRNHIFDLLQGATALPCALRPHGRHGRLCAVLLPAVPRRPAPVPSHRCPPGSASRPAALARPPRVALVLGGGAARGFAHVGVIQVLEEAGIRPDMVVGTSAGSLVAAIYASGKSGSQLQQIATDMEEAMLTDWTLPLFGRGVLRGEALARYVNQQVAMAADGEFFDAVGDRGHRPAQRRGHPVPPRRYRCGGAGIQRGALGVPARAHRHAGVCRWRVWWPRCPCDTPARWAPNS
jgi:hypothetical protein